MVSVIFDCDGVLVDSEILSCGAWLPVLHRGGIEAELADVPSIARGMGLVLIIAGCLSLGFMGFAGLGG